MPHPALGLPPSDATAGHPDPVRRLRHAGTRIPGLALQAALRIDPTLRHRYDEVSLRRFLRDYEGHLVQLARALATGEPRFVVTYGESIVPVYRRRGVPMNDVVSLLRGLEEAATSVMPGADADAVRTLMAAWIDRTRHHRRLPGDHAGNAIARFIWKGAGLGDDSVV